MHGEEKRTYVTALFNRLASRYDALNLLVSLGQTTVWRKRALRGFQLAREASVLDVGCGTGWVVRYLSRRYPDALIEGVDISPTMVEEARKRDSKCTYLVADVASIPRDDEVFDLVTTVFTTRNFPDLGVAIREMLRVLKPGGRLLILDSFPQNRRSAWWAIQRFWMRQIVPVIVRPFADPQAYKYLAESIESHVSVPALSALLLSSGAEKTEMDSYSFGSAWCIVAKKASSGLLGSSGAEAKRER
jgi:demethylmenaquinone methyltransferase/2-methoxy-6-polyprenyl-1,4-benzoquinol methylase